MDTKAELRKAFPDTDYYTHQIASNKVLPEELLSNLEDLGNDDPLAAHLKCMPCALVMHKKLPPKQGSFYVRFFEGKIKLEKWEVETYESWYPTEKVLLISPHSSEHIWLADYLKNKSPSKSKIVLK